MPVGIVTMPDVVISCSVGTAVAAAQLPAVQTPDAHSVPPVHGAPTGHEDVQGTVHLPDEQVIPAVHTVPHAPQLASSEAVSTQRPLQSVAAMPEHIDAQVPAEHTSPGVQTTPHAPQLSGSSCVRAQYADAPIPHVAYADPQVAAHALPEQTCPAGHALAQAPQFLLSDCLSTQVPLQRVDVRPMHIAPHAASEQ